jgi:hypothetical protein
MFTKTIEPIIEGLTSNTPKVIGSRIEYRLFGLLLYLKTIHTPAKYGITEWGEWYYRI